MALSSINFIYLGPPLASGQRAYSRRLLPPPSLSTPPPIAACERRPSPRPVHRRRRKHRRNARRPPTAILRRPGSSRHPRSAGQGSPDDSRRTGRIWPGRLAQLRSEAGARGGQRSESRRRRRRRERTASTPARIGPADTDVLLLAQRRAGGRDRRGSVRSIALRAAGSQRARGRVGRGRTWPPSPPSAGAGPKLRFHMTTASCTRRLRTPRQRGS